MTDEQINAAIAEACGWKSYEETNGERWLWCRTNAHGSRESSMEPVPYCNDLNAMHEAEKTLTRGKQWRLYLIHLANFLQDACHAAAKERAIAFLKTLGKWEEAE